MEQLVTTEMQYGVLLLTGAREVLTIQVSTDFEVCKALYKQLVTDLNLARKNQSLFCIEKPIIKAFDPLFVLEISLLAKEVPKAVNDNPYAKKMINEGFSNTLKNTSQNWGNIPPEMLDGGYR